MKVGAFYRLTLGLLLGLCVAGSASAATSSAQPVNGTNYQAYFINGETIPTSSYIEKTIYGVARWESISVLWISSSSGTITTANIIWSVPRNGGVLTARNDYMAANGQPYRSIVSDIATVRIYSNKTSSIQVTANIVLRGTDSAPKRHKSNLALTVPATSTTFTVTAATQGYWLIRPNIKIYLDLDGGTATSGDLWLNANDVFNTNYLKSGDVIKMVSATTTANVLGEVYE